VTTLQQSTAGATVSGEVGVVVGVGLDGYYFSANHAELTARTLIGRWAGRVQ
jgi:hypothetical protein